MDFGVASLAWPVILFYSFCVVDYNIIKIFSKLLQPCEFEVSDHTSGAKPHEEHIGMDPSVSAQAFLQAFLMH